jgi:GxxExxY protein
MAVVNLPNKPIFEGKHADISRKVIDALFKVHNELGYGFSEKVYEKAFAIALREMGLKVVEQIGIKVFYHGQVIGEYIADMLVNDVILLELKTVPGEILDEHEAQLLNYLKATEIEVGYVINFGKSASFKRKVFDNQRKGSLRWREK